MRTLAFLVMLVPGVALADETVTATAPAPSVPAAYPLRRIDRPRTLPVGALQAAVGMTSDQDFAVTSRGEVIYAPVNKLEARVAYTPRLSEGSDFAKPVVARARAHSYKAAPPVFLATPVGLPVNTTGDVLTNATLGVPTKLKLDNRFAFYFGDRLLKTDWSKDTVVTLNAPLEVGAQVEDHTFVSLGTTVATVPFNAPMGTASTTIADVTPVLLSGYLSPANTFDLGAQVGFADAQNASSTLVIALSFAYRNF
jgi:hypothetical protein